MSRQQRNNQRKALRRKGRGRRQGDTDAEEFDEFEPDEFEEEVPVTKKKKKAVKKDEEEEEPEEDEQ